MWLLLRWCHELGFLATVSHRYIMTNNLKIPGVPKLVLFLVILHLKGRNPSLHIHKSIYFIIEGSEVGQACFSFGEFLLAVPSYLLLLHMPKNVF